MWIVKNRIIFYIFSTILFAVSFYGIFTYGFNQSIDFRGGTITEVKYTEARLAQEDIESGITKLGIGGFSVRPSGDTNYIIRTRELTPAERELVLGALGHPLTKLIIERQNTIGPVAGSELKNKAMKAIVVVVLMIVLFVTFAFRGVSKPVSSWKYGLAVVIALIHDVVIPTGVFVFLGHYLGVEIDLLFVTGLLAILGYSVHDSIVVFDRVRENLRINQENNTHEDFETLVGKSVNQTFARSINTSLTIFITLIALYIFGPAATKHFALLLTIGVIVGTYSSIFVASPLLVTFYKLQKK
ncbi:MAG: protein translocase subunit SecF [bacterium]|nr:protein translocase subunit SecF [bacterium]